MSIIRRSRSRAVVGAAKWTALAFSLLILFVWLASLRYHAGLIGRPFNRAYAVTGGEARIEWFSREANGSTSGFGNPGWKLRPRTESWVRWRPHISTSTTGTHHQVIIPLWPLPLLMVGLTWWLRRLHRRLCDPALCASCGYSHEGLPKSGRCPECGAIRILRQTLRSWLVRVGSHLQPPTGGTAVSAGVNPRSA